MPGLQGCGSLGTPEGRVELAKLMQSNMDSLLPIAGSFYGKQQLASREDACYMHQKMWAELEEKGDQLERERRQRERAEAELVELRRQLAAAQRLQSTPPQQLRVEEEAAEEARQRQAEARTASRRAAAVATESQSSGGHGRRPSMSRMGLAKRAYPSLAAIEVPLSVHSVRNKNAFTINPKNDMTNWLKKKYNVKQLTTVAFNFDPEDEDSMKAAKCGAALEGDMIALVVGAAKEQPQESFMNMAYKPEL